MALRARRISGFAVSLTGIIIAILGVLWITVIFPWLDKVPGDYERSYYFEGELQVIDIDTGRFEPEPIIVTRAQKAVGSKDGALLIREVLYVVNPETGGNLTELYGEIGGTMAINPRTLEMKTEVDEIGRWGYWGPPRPLDKG